MSKQRPKNTFVTLVLSHQEDIVKKLKQVFLHPSSKDKASIAKRVVFLATPRDDLIPFSTFMERALLCCVHIPNESAGSGFIISNNKNSFLIATCAHCLEDDDDEEDCVTDAFLMGRSLPFVSFSGEVFSSKCVAVNVADDVALCLVTRSKQIGVATLGLQPTLPIHVTCIGNPADFDLEANNEHLSFSPPVFFSSAGELCISKNKNKNLGDMQHTCFTYWGHSGAPLFNDTGEVVAMHNSWDDKNGMRHAVGIEKIKLLLNSFEYE